MSEANDIPAGGGDNQPQKFANLNSLDIYGPREGFQVAQAADQTQMQEYNLPNGAKLYMSGACEAASAYLVDKNGTRHEFDQSSISFQSERNADGSVPGPSEIMRSRTFRDFNIGIERGPNGNRVFYSTGNGRNFREIFGKPCLVG